MTEIVLAVTVDNEIICIRITGKGATLHHEPLELVGIALDSVRHRIRALGGAVNVEHLPNGSIALAVEAPIANVIKPG